MFESPVDLRTDIIHISRGVQPFMNIYIVRILAGQIINVSCRTDAVGHVRVHAFDRLFHPLDQVIYLSPSVCINAFFLLFVGRLVVFFCIECFLDILLCKTRIEVVIHMDTVHIILLDDLLCPVHDQVLNALFGWVVIKASSVGKYIPPCRFLCIPLSGRVVL